MKMNTNLKWTIILLMIFFSFKSLSELIFVKGTGEDPVNMDMIKLSTQIFPFSSENYYRYGKILLERYSKGKNDQDLKESRRMFRRSITLNNLNYSSHFLLGKSYLADDSSGPGDFEKGLKLIKNASGIRKTNLGVNVNTIKLYLSLWPFIGKDDRDTAYELMKISMSRIKQDEFNEILEVWGYYSKDSSFLNSVLNEKGKYYSSVSKELIKHELSLEFRNKILTQSEYLRFKRSESDRSKVEGDIKKTISLYKSLNRKIKGYYKFVKESKFREALFLKLKKDLLINAVNRLLDDLSPQKVPQIITLVYSYLDDYDQTRDIELLDDLLHRKKFYNSNDLNVFHLKQLMVFRTGQISKMINETENFRASVSFVREGQEKEMAKLLTLLTDAYIQSRLLTKAMDVLKDIEEISPGLMSTYWRVMRVESIIGEEPAFDELREEKFNKVKNSNTISIKKAKIKTEVYPYEVDKLVLNLDPDFETTFREHHLLQVFVNNQIFYESYIGKLQFPVEIPLPHDLLKEKFDVEVKIVK